ncbi:conserved Plasmodium protein, unknown function [Plasmodium berghei]|uniref:Ookinete maturation protein 1 n=2 Tax=Plasmodium berghei TaxID=5821 RepID=OMG1_PLABA|nr:conserved Plasmodium protein, unknown function [Plasmodium berghei ANKA]A0A509AIR7.1 RecName: Full=Ookinete maturation protein 1 [Plasmodium berghei ANKA]CXI08908.1 conserved Plasmodium protein, unknown function [Plasmodium berghei]SCL92794.1 conserved Plasmodium protein, unknown function [Plasmodium berghei]SCN22913.1 conserved Plasmodium protein, unknown function [Plasmodium berghei]VUC54495.1 conserved Plasmodium protein, unknown function [Plasmodium berghei ANKA]|eukprot:XP_034420324.1 conserved Plasmodium protein, unknown function [Plasmodium berghei ANKA]
MNRTHMPNNHKIHEGINMKSSINEVKKSKRIEKELSYVTNSTKKKSKKKQTNIKKIGDVSVNIENINIPNNLNLYTDNESVVSSKYKKKKKKKKKLNIYNNNDNSKYLKPQVVKKKNSKIIFLHHNENNTSTHSGESSKFQKLKKKKKIKKGTKKKSINKISILKHKSHESFPSTQNENTPELEPKQVNLSPLEIEINKTNDIDKHGLEINKTPSTQNFNDPINNLDNNEKIKDRGLFHGIDNIYENYITNDKENMQSVIKNRHYIIDKNEQNEQAYNNDMNITNFIKNGNTNKNSNNDKSANSNDYNKNLFCELTEAIENDGIEQTCNRNINIRLKEEKEAEEEERKKNEDEHILENGKSNNEDNSFDKKDDLTNLGKSFKNNESFELNSPQKNIRKGSLDGMRKKKISEKKMKTKIKQKKKRQNNINDTTIGKKKIYIKENNNERKSSGLILGFKKMKKKLSGKRIDQKKEYKEKEIYSDKLKDVIKDKKKYKKKDIDDISFTKDIVKENVKGVDRDDDEKKRKTIGQDEEKEKIEIIIVKKNETGTEEEIKVETDENPKVKTKEKCKIENGEGCKIAIDEENSVFVEAENMKNEAKLEADVIIIEDAELRKDEEEDKSKNNEKDSKSEERDILETQMAGKEEKPVLKKKKKNKGKQRNREGKGVVEKGYDAKREKKENEEKNKANTKMEPNDSIEQKDKLSNVQNMSNIVKNNKVNKILEKYIISKKEENLKRKYMNTKKFMDILDISEKKFKIDTINFFPHTIGQVCYSDIYFFFDTYEKELKKSNTGKNTIKLMKKLFKCEYIEMNNMELILQIFDKIIDKLKKELKTESIVKIYDEEEHVIASKIMKYKNGNYDKYMYNKKKYDSNNEYSISENNLFNQNPLHHQNNLFGCNRNKLYNIIFNSSQGEYIMGSHSFLILQQWNDEYKLAMLRDKLEQIKKRKQNMNDPIAKYIKSLKYGFIDSLFSICCLYDCKKNDNDASYCDFPLPSQNTFYTNTQIHLDNMNLNSERILPMKITKAVQILASS